MNIRMTRNLKIILSVLMINVTSLAIGQEASDTSAENKTFPVDQQYIKAISELAKKTGDVECF